MQLIRPLIFCTVKLKALSIHSRKSAIFCGKHYINKTNNYSSLINFNDAALGVCEAYYDTALFLKHGSHTPNARSLKSNVAVAVQCRVVHGILFTLRLVLVWHNAPQQPNYFSEDVVHNPTPAVVTVYLSTMEPHKTLAHSCNSHLWTTWYHNMRRMHAKPNSKV